MATIDVPDDRNWLRVFRALIKTAHEQGRLSKEARLEIKAGKTGVEVVCEQKTFIPDA